MKQGKFRVAIVGAASLKAKELADVLNEHHFPAADIRLLDDDESLGQLEAVGDEMNFVQSVRPEHFDNVDFAFFASDSDFTRRHWKMAERAGCNIVDLSYGLEEEPGAKIRAPWIERELGEGVALDLQPAPIIAAHPAAQVLALLLLRLRKLAALKTCAAVVFEPASEQGRRGMDELHEQTVNLLSFRELPKKVFDTQVAFNVVASYGEQSPVKIVSLEQRLAAHFRAITHDAVPVPSLMLVQAPSFHAHVFSVYVELERAVALGDLSTALAGEHVEVTRGADESPSNVNAAGQEDVLLSVRNDANNERGFWIWAAADNLRVAGITAVECAETMMSARPKGQVQ